MVESLLQVGVSVVQPHRKEVGQILFSEHGATIARSVAKVNHRMNIIMVFMCWSSLYVYIKILTQLT